MFIRSSKMESLFESVLAFSLENFIDADIAYR